MKITIDTETNIVKLGRKTFDELDKITQNIVAMELVEFFTKNSGVKELDLENTKIEELAQEYVKYVFDRHNIDPDSKEGKLIYYAYIHGIYECLTQLRVRREKVNEERLSKET